MKEFRGAGHSEALEILGAHKFGGVGMDVRSSKEFGVSGLGEQFQPPLPLEQPRVLVPLPHTRLSSPVSGGRKAPALL